MFWESYKSRSGSINNSIEDSGGGGSGISMK